MPDRIRHLFRLRKQVATLGLAVAMLLMASKAWPQAAPPPTLGLQSPAQQPLPPRPEPQQIEPQPSPRAGLINETGKLFGKSKSLLPPRKNPSETTDDFTARTKDPGQSL